MNVLFLVYNRPVLTKKVLGIINKIKPDKLYIAADGPRNEAPFDKNKCEEVRLICDQNNINAKKVYTLFRNSNLGPFNAVIDAINWFFHNEKDGIILEDDCLPDITFFKYCNELLKKYANNEEIYMISGSNFIPNFEFKFSYSFSKLALIWGWATWKRAWCKFDINMEKWPSYSTSKDFEYFGKKKELLFNRINNKYTHQVKRTWAVVWRSTFLTNKGLCIRPRKNLIRNIGFGHPDSINHKEYHKVSEVPLSSLKFPLSHPKSVSPNREFDIETLNFYYDLNT